jgi:L-lactate dehydrogenase complex protein LldE
MAHSYGPVGGEVRVRVALFVTCLADQAMPDAAVAALQLLRRAGVDAEFPEAQTCCGQPAFNAGYHREAREIAAHHLRVFEGFDRVVLPSGSCASMLVGHYPHLFDGDPQLQQAADDLSRRTREWSSFLVDDLQRTDLGADLRGVRVTVHDGCHGLRTLKAGAAPRRLLQAAGAEVVEADGHDTCCGFGGLFGVKMPEVSTAMARAKHDGVHAAQVDVLTSTDVGCLMQLGGSLRHRARNDGAHAPRIVHLAELLYGAVVGGA